MNIKNTEKLVDEEGKIVYKNIISKYPWITEKYRKCILSPDSDGLLCGLLMSNILNWQIVGYYDGKVLVLKKGESTKDCVFLDMEIFRNYVKSLGHHMVRYNNKQVLTNWNNFDNCIQPNNIRGYDAKQKFNKKYPLGAIHLLLGIIGHHTEINIKKEAICPLLYTDGTFKNLFNYPDNCLSWLSFLCANDNKSPLKTIFFNDHYTTSSLMIALKDFFEKLREINGGSRGGDKIKLSNSNGEPVNFVKNDGSFSISNEQITTISKFLDMLGQLTGWKFKKENWNFNELHIYKFTKGNIKPSNSRFQELIEKNPLSWAMTSTTTIEYTLEEPNKLP